MHVQRSIEEHIQSLMSKVATPGYRERTPAEVQAQDGEKLGKAKGELAVVQQHVHAMQAMLHS